jgi:hypothetical protein
MPTVCGRHGSVAWRFGIGVGQLSGLAARQPGTQGGLRAGRTQRRGADADQANAAAGVVLLIRDTDDGPVDGPATELLEAPGPPSARGTRNSTTSSSD